MFNNLIESSSHAEELKRRGSFFLLTTVTYVVLFAITGVASIYAYDTHMGRQETELELLTWWPVPTREQTPPEVVRNPIRPASGSENPSATRSTRTELIDSTSNPNNAPPNVGTVASDVPEARPDSVRDFFNADPPTPASGNRRSSGGAGNFSVVEMPDPPPLPAPNPPPVVPKVIKVSRVLNSQAIALPKPNYPPIAKQIKVQGTVIVQVLIDETGTVVSAKALSGHPLLVPEAQRAAMQARFSPTLIGDQPVKVSGMITYNFVMQ